MSDSAFDSFGEWIGIVGTIAAGVLVGLLVAAVLVGAVAGLLVLASSPAEGATWTFTPSPDPGAVHVCVAWSWSWITWACWGPWDELRYGTSAGGGSCARLIGPKQIPCTMPADLGPYSFTFPDPPGPGTVTMARIYAVWDTAAPAAPAGFSTGGSR